MSTFSVIIAAAGKSSRFRDPAYKKPFIPLNQKPVWLHSVERFQKRADVRQTIVVIAQDDMEAFTDKFGANVAVMGITLVIGGDERADSVQAALSKVDSSCEYVAIHDAARPCVSDGDIDAVFSDAIRSGAAILATPVNSTVKSSRDGRQIDETIDRKKLWLAQTPQVFRKSLIVEAYANRGDLNPTDEAQLLEEMGHGVTLTKGSPMNIKITTKADLAFAAACLKAAKPKIFDAPPHPFADGDLWR